VNLTAQVSSERFKGGGGGGGKGLSRTFRGFGEKDFSLPPLLLTNGRKPPSPKDHLPESKEGP